MVFPKVPGSILKRVSRVRHTYRTQVVEAIRISHELAGNSKDHRELCVLLVALEGVIEVAVKAEGQPEDTTTDIFSEFVSCLKNDPISSERMAAAKNKDKQKSTQSVAQSMRLKKILEQVITSPLRRSKHFFVMADPHIVITVDIPCDAKLPDILWKLRRDHGHRIPSNPHFYPKTAFGEPVITPVHPLHDRNANTGGGRWTERIYVYGDSKEGRIRLTSEDGTIAKLFGAVTECLVQPQLTLFKDIEGHLLAEKEVDRVFLNAPKIKCFRWRDSSFVIDPHVETVQDVIVSSKRQQTGLVSSPSSMGPADLPQELRRSTSGLGNLLGKGSTYSAISKGSSQVIQPSSAGPPLEAQDSVGHHVPHTSSNSPLYDKTSNPPCQQTPSGSLSTWHTEPVDPFIRPSHPPPDPPRDQDPLPSEAAEPQVVPAKSTEPSFSANGGAKLAGSPESSSTTALATVESWRDGTPATHDTQGGSPAVDIPQPNRQSRPALLMPTRSPSRDESIISSSPTPSSMWSSRFGTPLSAVTTPSPGPVINHLASTRSHPSPAAPDAPVNKPPSGPPAGESYGTASIQRPTPTQPRQPASPQSPPPPLNNGPSTPKNPVRPSSPPQSQQAQRPDKRSWWRRTVDDVSGWLSGQT